MALRICLTATVRRSAAAATSPILSINALAILLLLSVPAVVRAQKPGLTREGSAFIDYQIAQGKYVIPNIYFGMHMNNVNTPWPTVYFANQRLEGSDVNWWNIETSPGDYEYYWLDQWLAHAQAHNATVMYTFVGVPQFYSSIPDDDRCTFNLGACDPPKDLNEDGTGTDASFKNFVTDLVKHNYELGNPIQYWEMWNEPDIAKQWIPTCDNPRHKCTGNLKYAQLLRMAADGYKLIKQWQPNAVVLTPAPVGFRGAAKWMDGYLAALKQQAGPYPDVIAFHGYLNKWVMGYFPLPENEATLVRQIKAAVQKNGFQLLPLWVTEGSWGNTILDGFTNNVPQTAFLARYTLVQQSQGVARGYWYQWDQPGGDGTLWQGPGSGEWRLAGYAYNSIVNWTMNATLTSGCANLKHSTVWICKYSRSSPANYLAEAVWNSERESSFTVPKGFKQYCDLKGNVTRLDLAGTKDIRIGTWPILLENENLSKGPCRQF